MPCTAAASAALVRLIQQQVAFDCALLLGVGLRPVYLYDNLHQRAYCSTATSPHFGQDPFMQALEQGLVPGSGPWRRCRGGGSTQYRHHFYQATGWQEEVGLILPVRGGLTLMLFLGRLDKRSSLSRDELARLVVPAGPLPVSPALAGRTPAWPAARPGQMALTSRGGGAGYRQCGEIS
jgi:hypothetical protein